MSKAELRRLASEVKPSKFLGHRDFLGALYAHLKQHFDSYSYVKFADDLGFSATNVLYLIIQGKRTLTVKSAEKIVEALDLVGAERQYFLTLVKYALARRPADRDDLFRTLMALKDRVLPTELDKLQLEFFGHWVNLVILEMASLPDFKFEAHWITSHILYPVSIEQVRKSMELLERLHYIELDAATGRHVAQLRNISTGNEVVGMAVASYHQKMMDLGKDSILRTDAQDRDVSTITVAVPDDLAVRFKSEIQDFRKKLLAMAVEHETETGGKGARRVVQLNIQLFPLTKAG